ncbi:DUF3574 domain-containing protein [Streptomyces sp. XD-27]|uniref:DUF3574 domain-containing protein n=1 Tax=Streptomyces sp. XD-27 TaxID=3062779 RepID=UPI0026F460C0|nr:DUF3574 domain-containing protein [Streptomyces sp. XD-27]WKX71971.1 DUF3574 domain-containing protein [Streptomyces sp. XD-27]
MPTFTPRARVATIAAAFVLAAAAPVTAYAALDEDPAPAKAAVAPPGRPYIETRLFFGTERPDGGPTVTDKQFLDFVDREVTPSFPDGLTIQDGRGQWRDRNGAIERERSYELILLYPVAEAPVRNPRIERIRNAYEREFAQDSVARLDETTRVDF